MTTTRISQRAERLCSVMHELTGLDPMERSRRRDLVTARMIVAWTLYEDGATETQLADLFGIRASTIHYYRNRYLSLGDPGWEEERELALRFREIAG